MPYVINAATILHKFADINMVFVNDNLFEEQRADIATRFEFKHQLTRSELGEVFIGVNLVLLLELDAFILLRFSFLPFSSLAGALGRDCVTTLLAIGRKSVLCSSVRIKFRYG